MHGRTGTLKGVLKCFLAATALLVVIPAAAHAGTTLGQTFLPDNNCPAGHTQLQSVSPDVRYHAPVAGLITSWSFEADNAPPMLKFKVGRPRGGNVFTVTGESGVVTPDHNELNTYPIEIPVQPGDVIGLYTATAGDCGIGNLMQHATHTKDADVPPGTTTTFTPGFLILDVAANLESPPCRGNAPTMVGTSGSEKLVGTPRRDVIVGLAGKDSIFGLGGNDLVCGNSGADRINGGRGKDRLLGQAGRDTLKGGGGRDNLKGGGARDVCKGGAANDLAKCEVEKSI